tara:strand:- start:1580 stop:2848 length:1269 start_codon:yes stop_codon:yes gene_type:complete
MSSDIFLNQESNLKLNAPLADKLRPKSLNDFYGQESIIGENSLLRNAILNDKVGNIIFSGPPGVGKTTLIEIISLNTRSVLVKLNAVLSGIKELRNEILLAQERWINSKRKTILFIDEVHRFTSAQQDALLPSIENGTINFIGATTENPTYSVNKALLSRSRIFKLSTLNNFDLKKIIDKVKTYYKNLAEPKDIEITQKALNHLINYSNGDARNLINALEMAINVISDSNQNPVLINLEIAEDSIQNKNKIYDKFGQYHFDIISAFIKSIRGSDPDATLYWLANMLEAGEDPNYIFRRLLISASEDIGLANPNAIILVNSCSNAFEKIGMPEGHYFLTQASLYLATSPKSNSTKSIYKAIETFKSNNFQSVPNHLKNNSSTYKNPHDFQGKNLKQDYMPKDILGTKLWEPSQNGWEKKFTLD